AEPSRRRPAGPIPAGARGSPCSSGSPPCDADVLVLTLHPGLERGLPARLVAASEVARLIGDRVAAPGLGVVLDRRAGHLCRGGVLGLLAAGRQTRGKGQRGHGNENGSLHGSAPLPGRRALLLAGAVGGAPAPDL